MTDNIESRAVAKAEIPSGRALQAFVPQSLDEAWRLSGALAQSGMLPKAYGTDQNKVMVGIIAGAELGLTPFAALQSIAVIGGNPALWGDGMLGLIEASGKLVDIEETDDGNEATCRVERVGRKTPVVRTFSMDDAKKAGLAGKAGPWTQYPKRMRQMRARGFALRDAFSDVLRGLKMAEEVRDYAPIDGGQMQSQPITAATLIEQATAEVVAEEVHDETTGEVAPVQRKAARSLDDMVDGYIAHVDAAEDLEALMLVTGGEDAGKLRARIEQRAGDQKDRLLGRMTQAGSARSAALSGEGPDDTQRGEANNGDDEDDDQFPGDAS